MKFKIITVIIIGLVSVFVLLYTGCEKKKEINKQKTLDMVTVRTLGLAFLEENKLPEAEEQFRKLIDIAPDEALGYANLGLVYMRMGKYIQAEEQFKKALKIGPNDPDIRLNLAEVYGLEQRQKEAIAVLEGTIRTSPDHVKSLYKLAQFYTKSGDRQKKLQGEKLLKRVVEARPANIAARLQLIEILLKNGKSDEARMHMEILRQQIPDLPKESLQFFDKSLALMASARAEQALAPTRIFHNFMKVTRLYQAGILELKGLGGPLTGTPLLTFSHDISLQAQESESILDAIRFTNATASAGLDVANLLPQSPTGSNIPKSIIAVADFDSDNDPDIYISNWNPNTNQTEPFLFRNDFGQFENISSKAGIKKHPGRDLASVFADYDNNGYLDLFITNTVANLLYKNVAEGKFQEIGVAAGVAASAFSLKAVFADLDHDGDLDLYLANAGKNQFYRNNSDGTFTELSARMGISAGKTRSRDIAIGDFDEDGDLDFFVINEDASNILYTNLRQGRFQDITETSGLKSDGNSGAVAAGDYNNDGFLDLFVTGLEGGSYSLYKNKGNGTFEKDNRSSKMFTMLSNFIGLDAQFFDFDNDGFLDLLVAGKPTEKIKDSRGLLLFHNDGTGKLEKVSSLLPEDIPPVSQIAVADYNEDGDMDIFFTKLDGGIRMLRNDGGNVNKYLKVRLVGLRTGSGKNNYFGIGSKLEVRAGDLYQMRVVTKPVTHFGLGQHVKADVVRILWPNGVPQNLFYPGSDQDLVEEQILKGSCAFLYTWNGQKYTFVTDIMWRSALGMPLGIMGGATAYAFPNSSKDYFRIPGQMLKAQNGIYPLQITEELWETAYFDQVKLIAVDHPDTVDIFIDERFLPPPIPPLYIHKVTKKHSPKSAIDNHGNDLLPLIRNKDDVYISNLTPEKYQGITKLHDLILDLGNLSRARRILLFLNGWVFPTDASINMAISQSEQLKVIPPYLQVLDNTGHWQTVINNLSFPMGKNKVVIADLTDKFLTHDYKVRIRTNMQIYWDYIFFSTEEVKAPIIQTSLQPISADIHYRGFSRLYRKGGRYGPHWFDYSDVSQEPKWRDLQGYYTRYGDVLPLLLESDNKYVIINAGDEVTVKFDASQTPDLKPGWSRDFLIYTDGWIKDGDLNTAHGKTVLPLPFHGMSRYPYGSDESYPMAKEDQQYLKKYNTRKVTTDKFRVLIMSLPQVARQN